MTELTNVEIDNMIRKLNTQTSKLDADLDECLEKKERNAVLKRHGYLDRVVKLLYLLKDYD